MYTHLYLLTFLEAVCPGARLDTTYYLVEDDLELLTCFHLLSAGVTRCALQLSADAGLGMGARVLSMLNRHPATSPGLITFNSTNQDVTNPGKLVKPCDEEDRALCSGKLSIVKVTKT